MSSGRDAHGPRGCTGAGTGLRPSERTGEIGHTAAAGSSVAEIVTITDIVFRAESSGAGEATEEATGGVRSILMVARVGPRRCSVGCVIPQNAGGIGGY